MWSSSGHSGLVRASCSGLCLFAVVDSHLCQKKKKEEAVAHCSEQSDLRPNDYGQNSRHPQAWLRAGLMPQAGRTGHLESRPLLLLVEEARAPSASHRQHAAKG